MATKEELFAAVRMLKQNCINYGNLSCGGFKHEPGCPLENFCYNDYMFDQLAPSEWPDPEEGGSEDGN